MKKFKNLFLGLLASSLILSLTPSAVIAAEDNPEISVQQIGPNNQVAFVEPIKATSLNPNAIQEVNYLMTYDKTTGVQSTRQLEPGETINSINSVTPQSQGGVLYSVLLTPLDGAEEADITFRIQGFVGSKPNRIDVNYTLYKGLTRGTTGTSVGGCSTIIQGVLNVKEGKTVTCNKKISGTGFYFGEVKLNIKNVLGTSIGTDSSQTRQILTNRRATVYPYHYDPYANKVMAEPARADWPRTGSSVIWGKTERGAYIKKYSELYPNNGWNWTGNVTHIHHVKPREFGGTNAFDNLIPIPARVHESIVSPWFTGY